MTGAYGIYGGIAAANRNVLLALKELAREHGAELVVLSLLETAAARPPFLPAPVRFEACAGSKRRFSLRLLRHSGRGTVICADHVRLAIPLLPLAAIGWQRTVIFTHGSEAWKRVRRGSRWALRSASLCVANSHFTLDKMRAVIPGVRGVACPLGLSPEFDLNASPPEAPVGRAEMEAADGTRHPLGDRMLLTVARMHPGEREKGHYALLDVLPRLLAVHPGVQLVFAGPGDDRETVAARARALGVGGRVFLPGYVPVDALQELYRRCYAFVMPSRQEGFGLVYLEAMNAAKPCVGCVDQGAQDIIVEDETGLLVRDPGDGESLFGVGARLLADPVRAAAWGRNGFARLHRCFTAAHHQARVKTAIGALIR